MKKPLLTFDFDGVLREFSMTLIYEFYMIVCEKFGFNAQQKFPSFEFFKAWYSHDWQYNMRRIGIVQKEDMLETAKIFKEFYEPRVKLFPWVEDILAELSQKMYIAIWSNSGTESIRRSLNGAERFVDVIIGFDRMSRSKPYADGAFVIMDYLKVFPQNTMFIGDSVTDTEAGQSAGLFTGVVSWGATETHDELVALETHMILYEPTDLFCIF